VSARDPGQPPGAQLRPGQGRDQVTCAEWPVAAPALGRLCSVLGGTRPAILWAAVLRAGQDALLSYHTAAELFGRNPCLVASQVAQALRCRGSKGGRPCSPGCPVTGTTGWSSAPAPSSSGKKAGR